MWPLCVGVPALGNCRGDAWLHARGPVGNWFQHLLAFFMGPKPLP